MVRAALISALLGTVALPAIASDDTWSSIRHELYGERDVQDGSGMITIDAPYRTPDDGRTDLAAYVTAPVGLKIDKVTVVLDENPMPVSAVFDLDTPQPRFFFDVTMRVNGPTPMHVVAETSDGQIFVAETFVKTSGTGACAAPPGTDPELALLTLGQMQIGLSGEIGGGGSNVVKLASLASRLNRMDVDISHPSHSGMQMDQISLLFVPMRYVENVDIDLDGVGYVDITGSISLSENPRVGLSVPGRAQSVDVTMTDTDGSVSRLSKKLGGF